MSPKLELVAPASFCFLENLGDFDGHQNVNRVSFFIHASVVNRTPDKIVIDRFSLGFKTNDFRRNMRQNLLRVSYPSWPRKKLGTGFKLMSAFYTKYGDEKDALLSVNHIIETKEMASGYLLFVSNTYGTWNPKISSDHIEVKLKVKLSSGQKLAVSKPIRVTRDPTVAEEFCPGIIEHISHESTWNHSLEDI